MTWRVKSMVLSKVSYNSTPMKNKKPWVRWTFSHVRLIKILFICYLRVETVDNGRSPNGCHLLMRTLLWLRYPTKRPIVECLEMNSANLVPSKLLIAKRARRAYGTPEIFIFWRDVGNSSKYILKEPLHALTAQAARRETTVCPIHVHIWRSPNSWIISVECSTHMPTIPA